MTEPRLCAWSSPRGAKQAVQAPQKAYEPRGVKPFSNGACEPALTIVGGDGRGHVGGHAGPAGEGASETGAVVEPDSIGGRWCVKGRNLEGCSRLTADIQAARRCTRIRPKVDAWRPGRILCNGGLFPPLRKVASLLSERRDARSEAMRRATPVDGKVLDIR